MNRPEAELEAVILRATSAPDVALWRNEVGRGYRGALIDALCDDCKRAGQRFRFSYGLGGPGSPDLIGFVAGMFLGLELKRPGYRPSEVRAEQLAFRDAVNAKGGRVEIVDSVPATLAHMADLRMMRARGGASE